MASVTLKNIYKIYSGGVTAVTDFNLDIADKEFIILVGPSGCGKSTTLRMIAGLEEISKGELYIGDVLSNDIAPKDRDIAMVFQNYALYPHMTVFERTKSSAAWKRLPASWTSPTCWTASPRLCPVVSVSVLPWAAPSSVTPRCSCWTSPFPTWTPSCVLR